MERRSEGDGQLGEALDSTADSPSLLHAYWQLHERSAAIHIEFQNTMAEAQVAFLRATQATVAALTAMLGHEMTGEPLPGDSSPRAAPSAPAPVVSIAARPASATPPIAAPAPVAAPPAPVAPPPVAAPPPPVAPPPSPAAPRAVPVSTGAAVALPVVAAAPAEAPLSHGQRALWFLEQTGRLGGAYNIVVAVRIRVPIDRERMRRSLQAVVERHACLRSVIEHRPAREPGDEPAWVQRVVEGRPVHFEVLDAADDDEVHARLSAAVQAPFDLSAGPLLRTFLAPRPGGEHVLALNTHHIVSDGWSMWLLFREWYRVYIAGPSASARTLPPVRRTYADFVAWQRERLAGESGARLAEFWRRRLAGPLPVLSLPIDHERPALQTYRGASHPFAIEAELTDALKAVARAHDCTPFIVAFAAFQVLLHRYSGQDELVVGSPVLARGGDRFADVVGFFVNPLVYRADFSDDPPFSQLLRSVKADVLAALEHQDYPFSLLVETLRPPRDPSRSPIFQAMFVFQQAQDADEARAQSHVLEYYDLPQREGQFEINVEMGDYLGAMRGFFKYNRDLFEPRTIERMADCYTHLLAGIAAEPARRVSQLPLSARRPGSTAPAPAVYGEPTLAAAAIAKWARIDPHAPAVIAPSGTLSRERVAAAAHRVARWLLDDHRHMPAVAGGGAVAPFAICLPRSVEAVVGMLAALECGVPYAPLDPSDPPERLRDQLARLAPRATLLPVGMQPIEGMGRLLSLEPGALAGNELPRSLAAYGQGNLDVVPGPDAIAYVMFTSGSTAAPKGVCVTQRNLAYYLQWYKEAPAAQGCDVPWVASPIFDASVRQVLGQLIRGAPVWLLPEEAPGDPHRLMDALASRPATALSCIPSLWQSHLRAIASGRVEAPAGLQALLLGGEPIVPMLLRQTRELLPNVAIWNFYGPTETTVSASCARLADDGVVHIGEPIADTTLEILDGALQPVPDGVVGELCITGAGVSAGYLADEAATARSFVRRPGSAVTYRSGDVARRRADGRIELVGRRDTQVKVRGYRIELGEVESVLSAAAPGATTVVVPDGHGGLHAFIAGDDDPSADPELEALRERVARRLPGHLVPAAFTRLDAVPRRPNGKIDRRDLQARAGSVRASERPHVPLRTDMERYVAELWCELLHRERVGRDDNFFDIGGHSLLLIDIQVRLEAAFDRELSIVDLMQHSTPRTLASFLEAGAGTAEAMDPAGRAEDRGQQRRELRAQLREQATLRRRGRAVREGEESEP